MYFRKAKPSRCGASKLVVELERMLHKMIERQLPQIRAILEEKITQAQEESKSLGEGISPKSCLQELHSTADKVSKKLLEVVKAEHEGLRFYQQFMRLWSDASHAIEATSPTFVVQGHYLSASTSTVQLQLPVPNANGTFLSDVVTIGRGLWQLSYANRYIYLECQDLMGECKTIRVVVTAGVMSERAQVVRTFEKGQKLSISSNKNSSAVPFEAFCSVVEIVSQTYCSAHHFSLSYCLSREKSQRKMTLSSHRQMFARQSKTQGEGNYVFQAYQSTLQPFSTFEAVLKVGGSRLSDSSTSRMSTS